MNLRPKRVDFEEVWGNLKSTVERIIQLQPLERLTWDHNFSDIYFLCVSIPTSQSRRLYFALKLCLERHTQKILDKLQKVPTESLLKEYNAEWFKFHQGAKYLQNLFGYLNKQLAKERIDAESQHTVLPVDTESSSESKGVGNLALDIWKTELVIPLSSQLTSYIIDIIEKDRMDNGTVDGTDVHHAILSFVDVNECFGTDGFQSFAKPPLVTSQVLLTEFYQTIFEEPFLSATIKYYKFLTNQTFADSECSVIQKMEEEKTRARRFLHSSSLHKIEQLCSQYLVNAQIERLNSVCPQLVQNEQLKDLRNMHTLLKPLNNALTCLVTEFENHVKKQGMNMTTEAGADPSQFVSSIQQLHEKFSKMVSKVFNDDGEFVAALDRALQFVVNHREDPKQPPKVSERLNRYIDSLLRKSQKNINETDIDAQLSNAITIFRYIDDKDLFQKYYSKMLSNRLIINLSLSMDLEESMITKMKEACGYEFTNKLSRMFTDVGLSRSLTERFEEYLTKENKKLVLPMNVMVLQAGAWPLNAATTFSDPSTSNNGSSVATAESNGNTYVIPPLLQECLTQFEAFYNTNHTGRKLTWLYNNSFVEVKLNYLDKPYIVSMNVYQLSILLLFSDEQELPIQTVVTRSALPLQTVIKCVKGFLDASVLTSESNILNDSSVLKLNLNMVSRRLRFKIVAPQSSKPQEKEVDVTCNTLQQDRKYYMECAIVRIMKARKVMKHTALIDEVIKQTASRFVPDVPFIKKNIEALIEKLYLQRTDQHDEYQYLA